jgi:hypothetical protein
VLGVLAHRSVCWPIARCAGPSLRSALTPGTLTETNLDISAHSIPQF